MQFNLPGKQAREEKQLRVQVASGGTPRWLQTPASRIAKETLKIKKEGEMWNLGLIDFPTRPPCRSREGGDQVAQSRFPRALSANGFIFVGFFHFKKFIRL